MIDILETVHVKGNQYDRIDLADCEFDDWAPTFPQMRDRLLQRVITGPALTGDLNIDKYSATVNEIDAINTSAVKAVNTGRVIDFGFLPNAVIMSISARGADMYGLDAAPLPFAEPFLMIHKWEGQITGKPQTGVYLVNPLEPNKPCGDFEIVELQCIMIDGNKLFICGDRATFDAEESGKDRQYACSVVPSAWRMIPGVPAAMNNGKPPQHAAASNVLDPIMAMLLILNTRNVKRETVRAADKLNKSRLRSGKSTIAPYDVVNAAPYVTALLSGIAASGRGAGKGGTHASPVPHIRQGHLRTYASGARTFIAETLVNVAPEAREGFLSKRSHYEVKQ